MPVIPLINNLISLVDAIEIANKKFSGQVWWRGLDKYEWDLQPSVFRDRDEVFEHSAAHRFIRNAPSRYPNSPPLDDFAAWLQLMQHYGLPTRLLDWTESPLTGAFFALDQEEYFKEEGALCALNPYALNAITIKVDGLLPLNKNLRVIQKPFDDSVDDIDQIIAVLPVEYDLRLMTQLAKFTVHGMGLKIDELERKDEFLIKFRVKNKSKLKKELKHVGVRGSVLFPDLDNLTEEIKDVQFKDQQISSPEVAEADNSSTSNIWTAKPSVRPEKST